MRRFALPAFLIALACTPAADACCFLKFFCCKSAAPAYVPAPAPCPGPVVAPDQGPGATVGPKVITSLTVPVIVSIAGQAPVSGNIPNPIDSSVAITIIVDTSFDPGASSEITIEDLGPVSIPTKGKGKDKEPEKGGPTTPIPAKAGVQKKYHPKRVTKKQVTVAPMAAPAAPGAVPTAAGSTTRVYWEAEYEIPAGDLLRGHRYRATATAGGVTSAPVTFETMP